MNAVAISIIMPAYNAEATISESIQSVLSQTYGEWELIIIDDCSTDHTPTIIKTFLATEQRITYVRNEDNKGVAFSRNRGVSIARGELIAFLDADDLMTPNKLDEQIPFMFKHNAPITYTASTFMDAVGKKYHYILPVRFKLTYQELLGQNLMSCSSVIVKKEWLTKYPFPEQPNIHEDFVVWLRIVKEVGCAYGLNEPLLTYRLSATSKSANRMTSAAMNYNVYRYIGYKPIGSAFMMLRYAVHSIKKRLLIQFNGQENP